MPSQLKDMVPELLSRDQAIHLMRASGNTAHAVEVANRIAKYDMAKRSRYIKAMVDNPDDTHAQLVRKSNRYYNKNMKLDLLRPAAGKACGRGRGRGVQRGAAGV